MQNFPLSLAALAVQYQHNPISVSNPSISIYMLGLETEIGLCWYWTARDAGGHEFQALWATMTDNFQDSVKFCINSEVNNSVTTCVRHCQ